jgi:SAM-dependent methyltransferase
VLRRYREEYDLDAHFAAWRERKSILYQRRLDGLPSPRPGADRICDVGCADGQFLTLARERGWHPFGVELNPPAAARSRALGIEVREGLFEEIDDLPWGAFDLVTAWDSIEHTPDPARFAERLGRLARPGGTVAITTLNIRSLAARVFRMRWSMIVEDHFTYWQGSSLRRLLADAALDVVHQHHFGLGRDFVAWLDRDSPPQSGNGGEGGRWDSRRVVLRAETLVNGLLDRTGAGVGIAVHARRRA